MISQRRPDLRRPVEESHDCVEKSLHSCNMSSQLKVCTNKFCQLFNYDIFPNFRSEQDTCDPNRSQTNKETNKQHIPTIFSKTKSINKKPVGHHPSKNSQKTFSKRKRTALPNGSWILKSWPKLLVWILDTDTVADG